MDTRHRSSFVAALAVVTAAPGLALAQAATSHRESAGVPRIGLALKVDALGAGADAAVALGRHVNLRAGVRALEVGRDDYRLDGIDLDARVSLRSVSAYLDWFPFGGGFHLSPGAMIYNGNRATALASVPAGQTFTVGGEQLLSSAMDPVSGTATVEFPAVAPAFVIGWGNLVPRGGHWSIPFELGVVYSRSPSTTLALRGTACSMTGDDCRDIARDPLLQAAVRAEEERLDSRLSPLTILPVVSLGVGYSF